MKRFLFTIFLNITFYSSSQILNYPALDNTKILFVGEAHRIQENYDIQLDLIKHYVEKEGFNAIILERPTSFQIIIDNMIKNNDTTGLYLSYPVIFCNQLNCKHNLKPASEFLINLASFARNKEIPIICFDKESDFKNTKTLLTSIIDTAYDVKKLKRDYFGKLKQCKTNNEIHQELINLYDNKKKWKKFLSKEAYFYINNVITNVYLENKEPHFFLYRESYLFKKFNLLLKENKKLKPIAIFGLGHTHKLIDTTIQFSSRIPLINSFVCRLNKTSLCKNKVSSIALTYFFDNGPDSIPSYFGCFENEDLLKLKTALGENKYFITRPKDIELSSFISEAFDYVIAINHAHKLFDHTILYRK